MQRSYRLTVAVVLLVASVLVGACNDDDSTAAVRSTTTTTTTVTSGGGDSGTSATTGATPSSGDAGHPTTTGRPSSTAGVTTTTTGSSSRLDGTWSASIQSLLAGGAAGGVGAGFRCDGEVRLTFHGGRNTVGGQGSCTMGSMTGAVHYDSSADYRVEGSQIVVSGFSDNSTLTFNGSPMQAGVGALGNGTVDYTISGNVLTITRNDPDLGAISQTYTRV